jgi:UDP-N-acetylmuramoyl-L-alanyl-D-glutamate--2,6-diaminopimelate ligase
MNEPARPLPDASSADIDISGLTADSRAVKPGFLFAALPGARADGIRFIPDAIARGAVAVLADEAAKPAPLPAEVPLIADPNPRRRFALMAARFYGRQPHTIAAVTGTSGKTSVASFARQVWSDLGFRAASMGTLGTVGPGFERPAMLTTPDPVALHRELAELFLAGIDHLAMEASSHGLDQYRLDGVALRAAAFTNLSRDHLDYHPDMAAYLAAKMRLFTEVMTPGGVAVLNADAPEYPALLEACRKGQHRILSYGRRGSELRLMEVRPSERGQRIVFAFGGRRHEAELGLIGSFQAGNVLAALGLVLGTGAEPRAAIAALEHLHGVPGRMQRVAQLGNGAAIFVDYAHKPGALEAVLEALRPHVRGKLALVFGCGGDRDAGKRPLMGTVAARLADRIIVTDDNPRSEQPAAIRRAILAACPGGREIGSRAEAIAEGIRELKPGDLLLIAGKGHERGQIIGDRVLPFDDAEVARRLVQERGGSVK